MTSAEYLHSKWSRIDEQITTLYEAGRRPSEICRMTGIKQRVVKYRLRVVGIYAYSGRGADGSVSKKLNQHERFKDQDAKFQKAMKAAIRMGLENAPIGASVNTEAPGSLPIRVRPLSLFSGCGSSASLCADLGSGERGPAR